MGQAADIDINVDGAISPLALFLNLKLKPPPRRPRQESRHDVIGWSDPGIRLSGWPSAVTVPRIGPVA